MILETLLLLGIVLGLFLYGETLTLPFLKTGGAGVQRNL